MNFRDWFLHQHPDVAWSIVLALTGMVVWLWRKTIWPAVQEKKLQRDRHDEVMAKLATVAEQFEPDHGHSMLDRLQRIEACIDSVCVNQQVIQAGVDFLFDVGGQAMWRSDAEGDVTHCSSQFAAITGIPSMALLGKDWKQIIHQDDLDSVMVAWYGAVRERIVFNLKYRLCHTNGTIIWVHGIARPIWNDGKMIGYLGTLTPIQNPRIPA